MNAEKIRQLTMFELRDLIVKVAIQQARLLQFSVPTTRDRELIRLFQDTSIRLELELKRRQTLEQLSTLCAEELDVRLVWEVAT